MSDQSYLLEIYDADGFNGPNPLLVKGKGVVKGPENTKYFIIEAQQDACSEGNHINQLALRAHYNEDSMEKLLGSVTTVGIALFKENGAADLTRNYGFNDFIFWKVGKITPKAAPPG